MQLSRLDYPHREKNNESPIEVHARLIEKEPLRKPLPRTIDPLAC